MACDGSIRDCSIFAARHWAKGYHRLAVAEGWKRRSGSVWDHSGRLALVSGYFKSAMQHRAREPGPSTDDSAHDCLSIGRPAWIACDQDVMLDLLARPRSGRRCPERSQNGLLLGLSSTSDGSFLSDFELLISSRATCTIKSVWPSATESKGRPRWRLPFTRSRLGPCHVKSWSIAWLGHDPVRLTLYVSVLRVYRAHCLSRSLGMNV